MEQSPCIKRILFLPRVMGEVSAMVMWVRAPCTMGVLDGHRYEDNDRWLFQGAHAGENIHFT